MNALIPVRAPQPFDMLDEDDDKGMPSDEERAAAFERVRAMLAAIPPKPEPTAQELEQARQRADAAMRKLAFGLLSDDEIKTARKGHVAFNRMGGKL